MDLAAIEKAGGSDGWRPYLYERVDGGIRITGCRTRPKMRGPNRGAPLYITTEDRKRVVVTRQDVERAIERLVNESTA